MKYYALLLVILCIGLVSADIGYEISWDEERVVNGREFEVIVEIDDDEDDTLYDGKLWIESKGKIISDRFDEKKESWRSGYYYINEFFVGGINKVSLRIDEEYSGFSGDAFIYFRVRDEEQIGDEIEVLDGKGNDDGNVESEGIGSSNENTRGESIQDPEINIPEDLGDNKIGALVVEPISLGGKVSSVEREDINTENIVYQSKGLKIIEYSVYGFVVLCVLLCVLVMWRKLD